MQLKIKNPSDIRMPIHYGVTCHFHPSSRDGGIVKEHYVFELRMGLEFNFGNPRLLSRVRGC